VEKRKTLLLVYIFIFAFSSIYIFFEYFNISGNVIINNNIQNTVSADNILEPTIVEKSNVTSPTTTTTTTLPINDNLLTVEDEFQSNERFTLPDSDGVDFYTSNISIYTSLEQTVASKIIEGVNLEEGCLTENIAITENQWVNTLEANPYDEEKFNFSLSVESELPIDGDCLVNFISTILNDQRGWRTVVDKEFQVVTYNEADFHIFFATPTTVDEMCYPLQTNGIYSCRNGNQVVINIFRWLSGAKDFGVDLGTYRLYLINHEIGHLLGWGHTNCPSQNALAPLMMQQSKTTDGCIPNGWPIYERITKIYETVSNFK
jgi:hypothetical protein